MLKEKYLSKYLDLSPSKPSWLSSSVEGKSAEMSQLPSAIPESQYKIKHFFSNFYELPEQLEQLIAQLDSSKMLELDYDRILCLDDEEVFNKILDKKMSFILYPKLKDIIKSFFHRDELAEADALSVFSNLSLQQLAEVGKVEVQELDKNHVNRGIWYQISLMQKHFVKALSKPLFSLAHSELDYQELEQKKALMLQLEKYVKQIQEHKDKLLCEISLEIMAIESHQSICDHDRFVAILQDRESNAATVKYIHPAVDGQKLSKKKIGEITTHNSTFCSLFQQHVYRFQHKRLGQEFLSTSLQRLFQQGRSIKDYESLVEKEYLE